MPVSLKAAAAPCTLLPGAGVGHPGIGRTSSALGRSPPGPRGPAPPTPRSRASCRSQTSRLAMGEDVCIDCNPLPPSLRLQSESGEAPADQLHHRPNRLGRTVPASHRHLAGLSRRGRGAVVSDHRHAHRTDLQTQRQTGDGRVSSGGSGVGGGREVESGQGGKWSRRRGEGLKRGKPEQPSRKPWRSPGRRLRTGSRPPAVCRGNASTGTGPHPG